MTQQQPGTEHPKQMRLERDVKVTMRDGVRISLCVYRPQREGRVPALFAASPYQHEFDSLPAFPLFLWRETGPIEWYVEQGYAYVHADVRGSGRSEGEFAFMDRTEQQDYVELIAWIARQPWCNGRVGGIGQSYYAMAQWLMATLDPPGLACIAPYDGLVDQYRCSNYHGGIFCSYRSSWYANLRADNQHRPAGAAGRPPMRFDLVGAITEHTLDDDWWRERSAFERLGKIKVPVLSIGHWGKMGCTCAAIFSASNRSRRRRSSSSPALRTSTRRISSSTRSNSIAASCCRSTSSTSKASTTDSCRARRFACSSAAPRSGARSRNGRSRARATFPTTCARALPAA
jgi:predicted acyl esterase